MKYYNNHQRVGYLSYRLYSLGWRNRLHNCLPLAQHWLLSPFLYYRRGFIEADEWVKEYRLEKNLP